MNAIWDGMWEAIKTLCDGENNHDWLTGAEKDIIRKPLSSAKTAKQRIGYGIDLVSFASACRPLSASVKGEVLQLAAEDVVTQLEKLGVDITDCANDVAQRMANNAKIGKVDERLSNGLLLAC